MSLGKHAAQRRTNDFTACALCRYTPGVPEGTRALTTGTIHTA